MIKKTAHAPLAASATVCLLAAACLLAVLGADRADAVPVCTYRVCWCSNKECTVFSSCNSYTQQTGTCGAANSVCNCGANTIVQYASGGCTGTATTYTAGSCYAKTKCYYIDSCAEPSVTPTPTPTATPSPAIVTATPSPTMVTASPTPSMVTASPTRSRSPTPSVTTLPAVRLVGMRSSALNYALSVTDQATGQVATNQFSFVESARWTLTRLANGKYTIRSPYGRYLSAQPDGSIIADRLVADLWEQFTLEGTHNLYYDIKTYHGAYMISDTSLAVFAVTYESSLFWEITTIV